MNTLLQVYDLAISLMNKHGLIAQGWRFEFDRSKKTLGWCKHYGKKITMSKYLSVVRPMDDIKDTILHECAHAICGHSHHHDWVWKMKCREIGCSGKVTAALLPSEKPAGKYTATCRCNTYVFYRRITRSLRCRRCKETLNIVPTGL